MKSVLAIRHVAFEGLGAFAPALERARYAISYVDIGNCDLRDIDPLAPDIVIILGGPLGAYDEDIYPFLRDELALAERRLAAGRPIMGICLGAQIMARVAGARVYPGPRKEIGFAPITLTEAGANSCLGVFAADGMTLHWHGDTFDLPASATRLASTPLYENQAFSLGVSAVGFQFHPEADGVIEPWLIGHACELAAAGIDIPALRAAAAQHGAALTHKADAVMTAWLTGLDATG